MGVWEHLDAFGGMPVHLFDAGTPGGAGAAPTAELPAPDAVAWKVAVEFDGEVEYDEAFATFLKTVDTTRVRALVLGYWDTDTLIGTEQAHIDLLLEHADRFPALRYLFVGDIVGEEAEISWIPPDDITPLLGAFPLLEELGYRFGQPSHAEPETILRPTRHDHLRRLRLQTGGMPAHVPPAVAACEFPALEHLDLWLGVSAYGGDATTADLAGVLTGTAFPALRHLGLMNSEIQDEVAAAVAGAPVVARLRSLDLSMGTLGDRGVEALLSGQPLGHLEHLSLRHHFVSEEMCGRLRAALEPSGVVVDVSDPQTPWSGAATPEEGRYTEVAE